MYYNFMTISSIGDTYKIPRASAQDDPEVHSRWLHYNEITGLSESPYDVAV